MQNPRDFISTALNLHRAQVFLFITFWGEGSCLKKTKKASGIHQQNYRDQHASQLSRIMERSSKKTDHKRSPFFRTVWRDMVHSLGVHKVALTTLESRAARVLPAVTTAHGNKASDYKRAGAERQNGTRHRF